MRTAAPLLGLFALSACAQSDAPRSAHARIANEAGSPILLRYLPLEQGGPAAFPEAQTSGMLDLSGQCVRLQDHRGESWIIVSSPGPRVERDAAGPFIESNKARLRHGSWIRGGGGWFTSFPSGRGALDRALPEGCASGPFVVVTGMEPYDPSSEPPPRSPPPPPVD